MTGPAVIIDTSMPAAQYHAKDAVSASLLKQIQRSPAHAMAYLQQQQEPTPAMLFGTAFHTCVLESERFASEYVVLPDDAPKKPTKLQLNAKKPSKETIENIKWWDEFNLRHQNATIITDEDYLTITAMSCAIGDHPAASKLVRGDGQTEVSMFWDDDETGLACKCRPDIWLMRGAGSVIVDLKTTEDASPEGFSRSIQTYGYGIQAAHYLAGSGADAFIFVAVEKKAPFAVAVYELDPLSLDICEKQRRSLLEYWANCRKAEMYPAYSDECQMISLPGWVTADYENQQEENLLRGMR